MYAIVLFIIGKLVNSQAAGLLIVAPMALLEVQAITPFKPEQTVAGIEDRKSVV